MIEHPTQDRDAGRVAGTVPFHDRALTPDEIDRAAQGATGGAEGDQQLVVLRQQLESLALAVPGRNPLRHVDRPRPHRQELDAVVEARRVIAEARQRLAGQAPAAPRLERTPRPAPAAQRDAPPPPRDAAASREGRAYEWERAVKSVFERTAPPERDERHEPPQPAWRAALAAQQARNQGR